jgi:hypothetical protein
VRYLACQYWNLKGAVLEPVAVARMLTVVE